MWKINARSVDITRKNEKNQSNSKPKTFKPFENCRSFKRPFCHQESTRKSYYREGWWTLFKVWITNICTISKVQQNASFPLIMDHLAQGANCRRIRSQEESWKCSTTFSKHWWSEDTTKIAFFLHQQPLCLSFSCFELLCSMGPYMVMQYPKTQP